MLDLLTEIGAYVKMRVIIRIFFEGITMRLTNTMAIAAVCFAGFTSMASAITFPTFVIDESASNINITQSSLGSATLSASFSAGVDGYSWTATSATDDVIIDNLIDWEVTGFGLGVFDVEVTLAFSSPDPASSSSTGGGVFGSFFGIVSGGVLTWNNIASVAFAQGSVLGVGMEGGIALGEGNTVSTGARLAGHYIVPNDPIAPVPLPASGLLLLSALGGFGIMSRRRRKHAA